MYKTFRRRPGGLLNILCTFNLPPVSKGSTKSRLRKFCGRQALKNLKGHGLFQQIISFQIF